MIRALLIAAVLLVPLPAAAATPISNEAANKYYADCLSRRDERMSEQSQAEFCACTSAQMQQAMTVEDVQTMGGNTQEARLALNAMLLNVYAPCMTYPVSDLVEAQCVTDEKIDMMGLRTDRAGLCSCVADKTGTWYSINAGRLMNELLARDPNMTDPISPVMDNPDFRRQSYDNLVTCLNNPAQ